MSGYLAGLNPEQREAVEAVDGPVLVLSGAGTGKTRVLTTRFAHILLTGRAAPGEMLAVTFTNKAAREMRERVAGLLGRPVDGLWLGTFHALGARMLRRHAEAAGLRRDFAILDTDDQLRVLKPVMEELRLDPKRAPPPAALALIQRWKDRGVAPDRLGAAEQTEFASGRMAEVYARYQQRLAALNAADFGDLLLHMTDILRREPAALAAWQRRFRYLLVDEYQDTNVVQYLFLRLLAQAHRNICCVGDDDQSIYSWRGAEVGNILRFEQDFPGARVIRLERNYRSTAPILAAAAGLIAHNEERLGKTLRPAGKEGAGEQVLVVSLWDSDEEARMVGERIAALRAEGHRLAEIAVLVRAGFQTRAFEERLLALAIPYRVVGGLRFYERAEIRDAVAYLRLLARPADDLAFERIVNVPRRGIGEGTLATLRQAARARGEPLAVATAAAIAAKQIPPRARETLGHWLHDLDRWREIEAREGPVVALSAVLEDSGYLEMWRRDPSPEAPGRVENLRELGRALAEFETLAAFLDHVSLVMENEAENGDDKLSLMTLHAAKGLEFDTVFLPGWEEGVFPNQRALDESGTKGLEEERRLAYVGLTRARTRAIVSFALNRRIYGNWQSNAPSRFLDELPADEIRREGSSAFRRAAARREPVVFLDRAPLTALRSSVPERVAPRPRPAEAVGVGARVRHERYGLGTVRAAEAGRLEIEFDEGGRKRILDGFVTPA